MAECRAEGSDWRCDRQAEAEHVLCSGHRTARKRHPDRELAPLRVYRKRAPSSPVPADEAYALHRAGFIVTAPKEAPVSDDGFVALL